MPEEMSVGMLFRRRSTKSTGGNGFTSASEGAISCTSSLAVASPDRDDGGVGASPKLAFSFDSMVVSGTARAAGTCAPDSDSTLVGRLKTSAAGRRGAITTRRMPARRARARRYVRLRSQRNVSRKKNANRTRSMPKNAASIHMAARQLNA